MMYDWLNTGFEYKRRRDLLTVLALTSMDCVRYLRMVVIQKAHGFVTGCQFTLCLLSYLYIYDFVLATTVMV